MIIHDLRQLQAFQYLAETRSFTATARCMKVSQSAISHSMKNLESSLSCKLIIRDRKKLTLTTAGEQLLTHTNDILSKLDYAVDDLTKPHVWGEGKLRIGIHQLLSEQILPEVVIEMRDCFPNSDFEVHSGSTKHLLELLRHHQVDLVIGITPEKTANSSIKKVTPLFTEEIHLILSPNHESVHGKQFNWEHEKSVITLHSYVEDNELVDHYLQNLSVRIPIRHDVSTENHLKQLVMIDMGVGFAPLRVVEDEVANGELLAVPIPGQALVRSWSVMEDSSESPNLLRDTFVTLFEHSFNSRSHYQLQKELL